jgi:hypothetical protein
VVDLRCDLRRFPGGVVIAAMHPICPADVSGASQRAARA